MKKLYFLLSLCWATSLWSQRIVLDIPLADLKREYVIASRVEAVSRPLELGTMKVYAGLRVYNPQLIRFAVNNDSLTICAEDDKRGPQKAICPLLERSATSVRADVTDYFLGVQRGIDVLAGRATMADNLLADSSRVMHSKGNHRHLEVSVCHHYATDSLPFVVTQRRSLLMLPIHPMEGRPIDARLGYNSYNRKYINRFRLEEGKPITFYIDNRFSPLWQQAIRKGIEDWNLAFARIGRPHQMRALTYNEAGADFDPYDLTHNCFHYVESDFANAMGKHWTDPRSGEILQADVLFYSSVIEKLKTWLLMHTGAYNADVADGTVSEALQERMLRYAAAHEIGHCLGLEHNFRASFAYPTESLRQESFCSTHGTTPSIMDYARFNYVAQPGDGVRTVFPPLLGAYDLYAIEAGYRAFESDADYRAFIATHQKEPYCLYEKAQVSILPQEAAVQPTDLGNDHLASSRYGISNIAALPPAVLKALKPDDLHRFYFQLLMHTVPCLPRADVQEFLEQQLNSGYRMLNSPKMQQVYGNRSEQIEGLRADFIGRVQQKHLLNIIADPISAGLWMPHQMVGDDVFALLRQDGVRLSRKDIYAINKRCLTGAALSLSTDNGVSTPFASASFVSREGLVLTNFHCVSSYVQRLSKGENNYMAYGCWTTSRRQEAPLFNLQVHQLLSIEDVTERVLVGTALLEPEEQSRVAERQALQLMREVEEPFGTSRKVYSLMGGQQYVLARYRTFGDVRIVACPPLWLGAYGGDADNWQWPRYACDFAFLRVYATANGTPNDYSPANVPYRPQSYLRLAQEPVAEGDLALVMGYPGQTRKEIPAFALDKIVNRDTRLRATALKAKIDYLRACSHEAEAMARSAYEVRIGKLMNVYLRSLGEIEGVKKSDLVNVKRQEDLALQSWINETPERQARYGCDLIARMDSVYGLLTAYNHMDEAFSQFVGSGVGIIPFAGKFEKLLAIDRAGRKSRAEDMQRELPEIRRNIREFFPSINMAEDCGMMQALLPIYRKAVDTKYLPAGLRGTVDVAHLYATSLLTDSLRLEHLLAESIELGTAALAQDTLYRICLDLYVNRVQKQMREATPLRRENTRLYGIYMRAKAEKAAGMVMPYDANRTLRFSTGRVKAWSRVADMAQRSDSVSKKMQHLLAAGTALPMACFTTNAETAAGNSGSAVLNARGELIGLNFDRTAAGTASIYRRDPLRTRNIVVSTDYIVWVIKHLSRSQHILEEIGRK